jgi:hypothetical protein
MLVSAKIDKSGAVKRIKLVNKKEVDKDIDPLFLKQSGPTELVAGCGFNEKILHSEPVHIFHGLVQKGVMTVGLSLVCWNDVLRRSVVLFAQPGCVLRSSFGLRASLFCVSGAGGGVLYELGNGAFWRYSVAKRAAV